MTLLESFLALGWVAAAVFLGLWLIGRADLKAARVYAEATERRFWEAENLAFEAIHAAVAAHARAPE